MRRANNAVQGAGDGLCGLYAIVNYLLLRHARLIPEIEAPGANRTKAALYHVLKAAEDKGKLKAKWIVKGISADDLIEVFNLTAKRLALDSRAISLDSFAQYEKYSNGRELMMRVKDYNCGNRTAPRRQALGLSSRFDRQLSHCDTRFWP